MFIINGYHIEDTRRKWIKDHKPLKDESEREYESRKNAAFANFKGKPLKEYDVESVARQYAEMLSKQGWDIQIKFYKLISIGGKKPKISRQLCDIAELPRIDIAEQTKLREQMVRPKCI